MNNHEHREFMFSIWGQLWWFYSIVLCWLCCWHLIGGGPIALAWFLGSLGTWDHVVWNLNRWQNLARGGWLDCLKDHFLKFEGIFVRYPFSSKGHFHWIGNNHSSGFQQIKENHRLLRKKVLQVVLDINFIFTLY